MKKIYAVAMIAACAMMVFSCKNEGKGSDDVKDAANEAVEAVEGAAQEGIEAVEGAAQAAGEAVEGAIERADEEIGRAHV